MIQERKVKIVQNKYGFTLVSIKKHHLSFTEFRSINWLPTKESSLMRKCNNVKFVKNNCPFYLNEIFEFATHWSTGTRNSFGRLKHTFCKTSTG